MAGGGMQPGGSSGTTQSNGFSQANQTPPSGYRPSSPTQQFYQPIYQQQYQNYNQTDPYAVSQYGQGMRGFGGMAGYGGMGGYGGGMGGGGFGGGYNGNSGFMGGLSNIHGALQQPPQQPPQQQIYGAPQQPPQQAQSWAISAPSQQPLDPNYNAVIGSSQLADQVMPAPPVPSNTGYGRGFANIMAE